MGRWRCAYIVDYCVLYTFNRRKNHQKCRRANFVDDKLLEHVGVVIDDYQNKSDGPLVQQEVLYYCCCYNYRYYYYYCVCVCIYMVFSSCTIGIVIRTTSTLDPTRRVPETARRSCFIGGLSRSRLVGVVLSFIRPVCVRVCRCRRRSQWKRLAASPPPRMAV